MGKERTLKEGLKRLGKATVAIAVLAVGASGFAPALPVHASNYDNGVQIVAVQQMQTVFTDVGNYWATEDIYWGVNAGVVKGYEDGTFKPRAQLLESEFASLLVGYVNLDAGERIEGKHWSQNLYDVLAQYELPFKGYNNDVVKKTAITRGQVARIVAAKNGFNLNERQAVYYMYENDLSNGMIPGEMTFESYQADTPLQRDQAVAFLRKLSNAGVTTFKGKPSPKGSATGTEIVGIEGVDPSKEEVDFGDFVDDGSEGGSEPLDIAKEFAEEKGYKVDDSGGDGGFSIRDKNTNMTIIDYSPMSTTNGINYSINGSDKNLELGLEFLERTGKINNIDEIRKILEEHLKIIVPYYYEFSQGRVMPSGKNDLYIQIFLDK